MDYFVPFATGVPHATETERDFRDAEIIELSSRIAALCEEGIALNLDPNCVRAFNDAKNEVWTIKQRSKAELAGHMSKGKW